MLLDSIRTQYDSLSPSEKKVALAVLEQPELAIAANITTLAKKAGVSEPTVVRFCRAIGFDGWHAFKLKLAQGLRSRPAPTNRRHRKIWQRISSTRSAAARSTRCSTCATAWMPTPSNRRCRSCRAPAASSSTVRALPASSRPMRNTNSFVPACRLLPTADPHIHSISASLLKKGDAVVAISQRGNSIALLRSVQLARASRRRCRHPRAQRHAAGRTGDRADSDRPAFPHRSIHADFGTARVSGRDRHPRRRACLATAAGSAPQDEQCAKSPAKNRNAIRFLPAKLGTSDFSGLQFRSGTDCGHYVQ
jgi:hypothetical protein